MGESVKVIVRCRPINKREADMKCETVVKMDSSIGQCQLYKSGISDAPAKSFTFDGAYYVDSTTQTIYNDICFPLVEGVCEGYNGTVFAYGQTGCGKSFSMMGITEPASQRGIIPRAFEHIFETIEVSENTKFLVHASYLEIYNEEIRDLLGKDHKARHELKEHPERGVYVKDLTMIPVHDVSDCEHVMDMGNKNRSVGATLMNADSSRSHSIFTITLEMEDTGLDGKEHIRAGKLNLVDLAGSERQAKTGATGDRLKEATKINLSLSALGNVISALVDGKSKHIPYRDSKLTRLLQDSLGGNTKTLMVACLSPADNNYDETLSTLRYANRAKNIKNKPKINEDPKDALLREYKEEIEKLKQMLMGQAQIPLELQGSGTMVATNAVPPPPPHAGYTEEKVIEESNRIKKEYEDKLLEMKKMYEQEQSSKEHLQDEMNKLKAEYDKKLSSVENQYPLHTNIEEETKPERMDKGVKNNDQQSVKTASKPEKTNNLVTNEVKEDVKTTSKPEKTNNLVINEIKEDALSGIPSAIVNDGSLETGRVPTSSPVLDGPAASAISADQMQQEALVRLQHLQQRIVGGEKKDDSQLKERHKKRKDHVFTREEELTNALKTLEDSDQVVVSVYRSVQEEIDCQKERMGHLTVELASAKNEIKDLQVEFELEREDYLETIRKQELQLALQKQLLDRVQPLLRRDCNYSNLDRVIADSKWDEDAEKWILPELVVERTTLPIAAGMPPVARKSKTSGNSPTNGYYDADEEDRYLQHLNNTSSKQFAESYFAPKRASLILGQTQMYANHPHANSSEIMRRVPSPFHQTSPTDTMPPTNARPVRLESLNLTSGSQKKVKKKKRTEPNL